MVINPIIFKDSILKVFEEHGIKKPNMSIANFIKRVSLKLMCRQDCKTLLKANEKYYDSRLIDLYKQFETEPEEIRHLDNLASRIVDHEIDRKLQEQTILYFCGLISEKTFEKRCDKILNKRYF